MTSEEQATLKDFAKLLFSDEELATLMEMDSNNFRIQMKLKESDVFKAVTAARLESEALIRTGIIEMAGRCSTPAQSMALDLLKQMRKQNV